MAYPASELATRRLNQRCSPFTAFDTFTGVSAASLFWDCQEPDLRGLLQDARMSSKRLVEARVIAIEGHRAREKRPRTCLAASFRRTSG